MCVIYTICGALCPATVNCYRLPPRFPVWSSENANGCSNGFLWQTVPQKLVYAVLFNRPSLCQPLGTPHHSSGMGLQLGFGKCRKTEWWVSSCGGSPFGAQSVTPFDVEGASPQFPSCHGFWRGSLMGHSVLHHHNTPSSARCVGPW